jgi:hypothetical protein
MQMIIMIKLWFEGLILKSAGDKEVGSICPNRMS